MRSLPLQCGTIQIASAAGERRHIRVSGLAKARLLWLFRNFYILDFSVLSRKEQQLIAQVWNTGSVTATKKFDSTKVRAVDDDAPDDSLILISLDLIGTVEGYIPQLHPATVPTKQPPPTKEFRVGDRIKALVPRPFCARIRLRLPYHFRIPAIGTAMVGVWLLGGAIALGPKALAPGAPETTPRKIPPSVVAAAGAAKPVRTAPPAPANPAPAEAQPFIADAPTPAELASTFAALQLPDAMASRESLPDLTPPRPRPALRAKNSAAPRTTPFPASPAIPSANREVIIRVTVNSEGRAQGFQILQGDRKKAASALSAATRFSFQPCAGSGDCDHLLKVTEYRDAVLVQRID